MDSHHLSNYLLEPDKWSGVVLRSVHMPVLLKVVELSTQLDEQEEGDSDTDAALHRLFGYCRGIAGWLPAPARGRAPHYTRTPWDMSALSTLIPAGLDLDLDGRVEDDGSGFKRWQANLHDHINGNQAVHPSDLEHNSVLSYDGGDFGSAWTPNLALARILLAAYLLAAIQAIQGQTQPQGVACTAKALAA